MEIIVLEQFAKDLRKIKSEVLNHEVFTLIEDLESANSIYEITDVKKLKGYKHFYRIRLGNYRIGCFYENKKLELMRIAHRKEIYKIFP